jgi:hypothetical protein
MFMANRSVGVVRKFVMVGEFKSFKQHWNQYAKYHNGMDVGELRQQLLNCADGALETLMYNSLGSQVDTLSQTDLFKQLEELAVVVVGKDVKQMVVPKVDMLHLSCEEPSCQFNMEMKDKVSAQRVMMNHMFVDHKRQEQNQQQQLCGKKGGWKGGAKNKIIPIINPPRYQRSKSW